MPSGSRSSRVLCFVLAGSLLGFLRWNFHPASIFVGTSGVMFIGYTLAVLSILGTAKVAVALLVLGVPIIDTFWIIVRRLASRRSPFTPDRGHVHHRLLDLGLSHTQTVLLIYAITAALAVLSFVLSGAGQLYAFLGVVVASGIVLFVLTGRDGPGGPRGRELQRQRRRAQRHGWRRGPGGPGRRPTRVRATDRTRRAVRERCGPAAGTPNRAVRGRVDGLRRGLAGPGLTASAGDSGEVRWSRRRLPVRPVNEGTTPLVPLMTDRC